MSSSSSFDGDHENKLINSPTLISGTAVISTRTSSATRDRDVKDLSGCQWRRDDVLNALRNRNRRQCHSFHDLIAAHCRLFETAGALKAENLHLTVQNEKLRLDNIDLQCELRPSTSNNHAEGQRDRGSGSNFTSTDQNATAKSSTNERVSMAFEIKLFRLQEELTELHRRKGENAQALVDLRNTLQKREAEIAAKDIRLRDNDVNLMALREIQKNLEQKIRDLEAANQMIKDEHQALQLAFNGMQDQYRRMQAENRELVERWMKQKALDADRLNEENDQLVKQNRMKLQKELYEAAKDPIVIVDPDLGHSPIAGISIFQFTLPSKPLVKFVSNCNHLMSDDAHDGEVQAVKWGPKGRLIATGGTDRKVKLWEMAKGSLEPRGTLRGSNAAVTSVDFDIDEEHVLGTSNDFASRVWTVSDQRLRHTLTGHSGRVLAAKFLGESHKVVSGSHDRTLKIWDLRSLACIRTVFTGSSCNDVVTDRHGSTIISGHFDKRIRFWDTRKESTSNEVVLQGKVTSLDISPDGFHLLSCVRDNTLKLLDLRMNQVTCTFYAEGFFVAFDWTRAVFTPDGNFVSAGSQDGSIFIWNVSDPTKVTTLKEHTHAVSACSWQCSGSSLVSCDRNKQVIVWSAI